MADALCGPSNALQTFQKHTNVDRTLQQDRLVSRRSPIQGFRSNTPNAGILDPEFNAFQSQSAAQLAESQLLHNHQQTLFNRSPAHIPTTSVPNWSSDFQRLHISNPPPTALANRPIHQPQAPMSGGWHQEFLQYNTNQSNVHGTQGPLQPYQPSYAQPQLGAYTGMAHYGTAYDMPSYHPEAAQFSSERTQGKMRQASFSQIDAAAFEQEFEAYAAGMAELDQQAESLPQEEEVEEQGKEIGQDVVLDDLKEQARALNALSAEDLRSMYQRDAVRPQHDIIGQPDWTRDFAQSAQAPVLPLQEQPMQQQQEVPRADDGDQLAQTAGDLLTRVSDNTSEKFQKSSFLSLMRQLRDREVRVEGDKMVNADGTDAASNRSASLPPDDDRDYGRFPDANIARPSASTSTTTSMNTNTNHELSSGAP